MFKKQAGIKQFQISGVEFIQLISKSGVKRIFNKVKYLGSGGFARCYQVVEQIDLPQQQQKENNTLNLKPNHYAFKIIKKSLLMETPLLVPRLKTQIKLHKKFIDHPHIVNFIESFEAKQYIYLLLQLCTNQTLNQLLRRRKYLTEQETRYYIKQLSLGLKELHSQNIIHRDIKLCNLFINHDMQLKIGDFGLSNEIINKERRFTLCGTANYMAPELLKGNHPPQKHKLTGHSYEVDIWSLGVVCYTLFYGTYPYDDQNQSIIYDKIINCSYQFPDHPGNLTVSTQFKNFIKSIFQTDETKRITLDQILTHQFLTKTQLPKELPDNLLKVQPRRDVLKSLFFKNTDSKSQIQLVETDQPQQLPFKQIQDLSLLQQSKGPQNTYKQPNINCQEMDNSDLLKPQPLADLPLDKSYQNSIEFVELSLQKPQQNTLKNSGRQASTRLFILRQRANHNKEILCELIQYIPSKQMNAVINVYSTIDSAQRKPQKLKYSLIVASKHKYIAKVTRSLQGQELVIKIPLLPTSQSILSKVKDKYHQQLALVKLIFNPYSQKQNLINPI